MKPAKGVQNGAAGLCDVISRGDAVQGRQEYGGSHATEEEAADAAWQLYLNLQGLPRDTPALPLQRMRPGTPRSA